MSNRQTDLRMKEIKPKKILYIKLGSNGQWEKECLEKDLLKFGYTEVSHEDCMSRLWHKVEKQLEAATSDKGAIKRHLNQIKEFYEADGDVLWMTFHGNLLWWCFSEPQVDRLGNNEKIRRTIDSWHNVDVNGNLLSMEKLSGSLQSIQGYRGTICGVKDSESEYLVNKINGKIPHHIEEARDAYKALIDKTEILIQKLHWKDFELLVDLIYREAGWKRISALGKTQKTIDLDLLSFITNEKISVQVKSKAGLQDYLEYKSRFTDMQGYARFFFVVHTPEVKLEKEMDNKSEIDGVTYWGPREVARLCVDYGLSEWVMQKIG